MDGIEEKISQVYVLLLLFFEQVVLLTQSVLFSRAVSLRTCSSTETANSPAALLHNPVRSVTGSTCFHT